MNVILTSYNRPLFLRLALESLLVQDDDRWHCYLMDDNSGDEVWEVIGDLASGDKFTVIEHDTNEFDRAGTTRYSVLINEVLPNLGVGVVGFLCDNVEYKPELVGDVLSFFDGSDAFSGYVLHHRDMWRADGSKRVGDAHAYGHWTITPPKAWDTIGSPNGFLDHSQVFHRLPVELLWDEDIRAVKRGDGLYFSKVVAKYGLIHCINNHEILTAEHLVV